MFYCYTEGKEIYLFFGISSTTVSLESSMGWSCGEFAKASIGLAGVRRDAVSMGMLSKNSMNCSMGEGGIRRRMSRG